MASHRIDVGNEFIPTCLDVAMHKVTGKVIVCVAIQTSRQVKPEHFNHFVVVYEFDQTNSYQVKELARIKSKVLHIT